MFGRGTWDMLVPALRAALTPTLMRLAREGTHTATPVRRELLTIARELCTQAQQGEGKTAQLSVTAQLKPIFEDCLIAAPDSVCDELARVVIEVGSRLARARAMGQLEDGPEQLGVRRVARIPASAQADGVA